MGMLDFKIGKQSNHETDLEGYAGEFAFCKIFNTFPCFARSRLDHQGDTMLGEYRIDVKTTSHVNGHLIRFIGKHDSVDYFALMVGSFPCYEFKGFMGASDLLQPRRVMDFGYGKNAYAARQDELVECIDE